LEIEAALPMIEDWEEKLATLENPELSTVAENLAALRNALLANDPDPATIGQLLWTLGKQAQMVANGPAGTQAGMERLSHLSVLLAREGESLANREEMRRAKDFRNVPQTLEGVSNRPVDYDDGRWPYNHTLSATGGLRYAAKVRLPVIAGEPAVGDRARYQGRR
jgi:hypothetical protein